MKNQLNGKVDESRIKLTNYLGGLFQPIKEMLQLNLFLEIVIIKEKESKRIMKKQLNGKIENTD